MTDRNTGIQLLHTMLTQQRDVHEQLERGPRQVKVRERLVIKAEEAWESKREALKQAKATTDRKSCDLRSNEDKIADLQAKLNAASSNKEYDVLRGQVDADTVANSVLEDEILESLDTVDRMQVAVGEAEQQAKQAREEQERCAQKVAAAEDGLRAQAIDLEARVKEAEKVLSGDTAAQYRRLVEAYGADALAAVDGNICTNCYVAVTPQSRVALNSGQLIFCNCGRLLYVPTDG